MFDLNWNWCTSGDVFYSLSVTKYLFCHTKTIHAHNNISVHKVDTCVTYIANQAQSSFVISWCHETLYYIYQSNELIIIEISIWIGT